MASAPHLTGTYELDPATDGTRRIHLELELSSEPSPHLEQLIDQGLAAAKHVEDHDLNGDWLHITTNPTVVASALDEVAQVLRNAETHWQQWVAIGNEASESARAAIDGWFKAHG